MRKAKVLWLFVFVSMLIASSFVFGAASKARTLNLPDGGLQAVTDDDNTPEITARVARISFIRGDVQIRRVGNQDWEKAALNLPLVEGPQRLAPPRTVVGEIPGTGLRVDDDLPRCLEIR